MPSIFESSMSHMRCASTSSRADIFPGHRPQIFTFYPRCLPNPKPQSLNYRSGLYKTPTTSLSSSALHETTPNYFSVPKHNPFDE